MSFNLLRSTFRPATLRFPPSLKPSSRLSSSTSTPAPKLTEGEESLKSKLGESFKGGAIEVQDVSGGCGTFYAISIAHESFRGLSTIKQHRMVNELLKEEIKGMHGMQLKTTVE